jgi:hypothetical protein
MVITVGVADPAHDRTINNGPACRVPINDRRLQERKVSLALALVASFSALSSRASFAFSAEAQQMCTGDAFRLCSSEIPDIPKITACMIKQRASLSSGCRAVLDRDLAAQSRKVAAQ